MIKWFTAVFECAVCKERHDTTGLLLQLIVYHDRQYLLHILSKFKFPLRFETTTPAFHQNWKNYGCRDKHSTHFRWSQNS